MAFLNLFFLKDQNFLYKYRPIFWVLYASSTGSFLYWEGSQVKLFFLWDPFFENQKTIPALFIHHVYMENKSQLARQKIWIEIRRIKHKLQWLAGKTSFLFSSYDFWLH